MMVALACVLTGAVLGLRLRVYMLVLTSAVAVVAIGVPALIEHGALAAVWRVGTGLMLLQAGYLAGIVTWFVIQAGRSSHQWPIRQGAPRVLSAD